MQRACFGLEVNERGVIVGGAPYGLAILRKARIRMAREAWKHFVKLGAKCERIG